MTDPFLIAWVASIPGIGPKRFASLTTYFPDLSVLLSLTEIELVAQGIPEKLAASISIHRAKHSPEEIKEFCEKNHIHIVRPQPPLAPPSQGNEGEYPLLLSQIDDPPVVLYLKGTLPDQSLPTIAVVGTRNVTSYGRSVTRELTSQLVGRDYVIVSGFMYGVDAIAHTAALDAGGRTICVLGYGHGVPFYPREHATLAARVLESGSCLLTEFPPWQHAVAGNFPSRNRIVSGLSLGVLVTEAASKSGSRITAQCAVDQGREVFAVPGPINSAYSEGTKELVNLGAKLVTGVGDIAAELKGINGNSKVQSSNFKQETREELAFGSELERQIYTYIADNAQASIEELIQYTLCDARTLSLALSSLELAGYIESIGNGEYGIQVG